MPSHYTGDLQGFTIEFFFNLAVQACLMFLHIYFCMMQCIFSKNITYWITKITAISCMMLVQVTFSISVVLAADVTFSNQFGRARCRLVSCYKGIYNKHSALFYSFGFKSVYILMYLFADIRHIVYMETDCFFCSFIIVKMFPMIL